MTQSAQQSARSPADKLSQQLNANLRSMELGQWKYLVSKIDEPTTARLIVEYLDNEPAQKARFAGIYIRARDTVQRARVRYARALKWGQMAGRLTRWVIRSTRGRAAGRSVVNTGGARSEPQADAQLWPELLAQ